MPVKPEIQLLEQRITALPADLRLVFAAACCERVVPVHEFDGYEGTDAVVRASDVIWKAALGEKVSAAALRTLDKKLAKCMPNAEEEPGYQGTIAAVVTLQYGLEVAKDGSLPALINVSRGEYDAYEALGDFAARDYEQNWQRQAVGLLERSVSEQVSRSMFQLLPEPPVHLFPEIG